MRNVLFILLCCSCLGKVGADDKLESFAVSETKGDEARVRGWMSEKESSQLVLAAYNEYLKRATYHAASKTLLIVSIPAYVVGLALTMGCGDTPDPERFCREPSTKIGAGVLGFGGMFGIIFGAYGLWHYGHPGPKTQSMKNDFQIWTHRH